MKKVTGFSLSEDVLQTVDERRGLASRSAYVEYLLNTALEVIPNDSDTSAHSQH